ncbi:MAG: GFA family protein [Bacteriovoracia bacterium]
MKHTGGCHCGKVKYEVDMNVQKAISCNCSMCMKKGTLLDFVPASNFRLLSGEDNLQDYQFNKHVVHHLFCKSCGVTSFSRGAMPDGTKMAAINVRCLDGVDLSALTIQSYDGKNL